MKEEEIVKKIEKIERRIEELAWEMRSSLNGMEKRMEERISSSHKELEKRIENINKNVNKKMKNIEKKLESLEEKTAQLYNMIQVLKVVKKISADEKPPGYPIIKLPERASVTGFGVVYREKNIEE